MKKNMINLAVASVMGLASLAATADDSFLGSWYALPGISAMNTDSDIDSNTAGGGFLKLGKQLSEHWDIQTGISHNRGSEDSSVFTRGDYKQTMFGVDALYMFSRDKFRPFLLAGLGGGKNYADYGPGLANSKRDNKTWMGNLGLGAQYLFNDTFGLQADLRQQWTKAIVGTPGNRDFEGVSNTLFNLGGIINFGAPKKVAMAEPEPMPAPEPAPYVAPEPAPAPAPAPAPEPVACKPTMETITIEAEELFSFDKSALKAEGRAALDDAATKIKANPDVGIVLVTGHTDRIGSDKYNQKLSERRAKQVKAYLVSQGVDEARLEAVGKGESEPKVDCAGVKGKKALVDCLAPNRRVDLSAKAEREAGCN